MLGTEVGKATPEEIIGRILTFSHHCSSNQSSRELSLTVEDGGERGGELQACFVVYMYEILKNKKKIETGSHYSNPGWSGAHQADSDCLELRDPSASAS